MKSKLRQNTTIRSIPVYVFALIWGLITIVPLVLTILSSLKSNEEIYLSPFSLPKEWLFNNYSSAAETAKALTAILNSLFLAIATVVFVTVIGLMAAYVLSRKKSKLMKKIKIFFFLGIMVPIHCTIIPISTLASRVGGKNSYIFLLLVYVTFNLAQAIFLYTAYLDSIDTELDDAAIIDGCGDVSLLVRILFPICKPIIATEAVFVFLYAYGELIFSLTLISDSSKFTVSRALLAFKGEHTIALGPQFAFVVMAVLPTVALYLMFHEQVQAGMLSGSVKG